MLETVTTRLPSVFSSTGRSLPVNAKCPRWLVPNCSSNPSLVLDFGGIMTPALLIRMSRPPSVGNPEANSSTLERSARSSTETETSELGNSSRILSLAASPLAEFLHAMITEAPLDARALAM